MSTFEYVEATYDEEEDLLDEQKRLGENDEEPPHEVGVIEQGTPTGAEEGTKQEESKIVHCKCGVPAEKLTSHSERNPNRDYYKCNNCKFFLWADQAHTIQSPSAGGKKRDRTPTVDNNAETCGFSHLADEELRSPKKPHTDGPTELEQENDQVNLNCKCGVPAEKLTSHSERNPNRDYYKCNNCKFFLWADQANKHVPSPQAPEKENDQVNLNCKCGVPAEKLTSHSERNPNRDYYKCNNCKFFLWADQADKQVPSPQAPQASGVCYRCGNSGHWAKDCPSTRRPTYGASPSRGAPRRNMSNERCFKCGLTGHWSRDCPNPSQGRGGRGRGW